jgi:cellobiose phosphorylase
MEVRRGKYNNIHTLYKGKIFSSKLEANHAAELDMLRHAKDIRQRVESVTYQYRIPVVVNNVKICDYYADFYVLFADGHKEIHESKGFKTQIYKIKKKLVEAIYGEKIIEFYG